jgi:DNA-binding response OmpR family regulator
LILVIEEAHGLRQLIPRALLRAGYHVLTAADLAQAASLLQRLQLQPVLAIVDLHASPLSRTEVVRALSRNQTDVCVIFVVRYLDDPDAVEPGLILEKPFSVATLCRIVENVLALGAPLPMVHDDGNAVCSQG